MKHSNQRNSEYFVTRYRTQIGKVLNLSLQKSAPSFSSVISLIRESAKLCALGALVPYVPRALRALVPRVLRALVSVPHLPRALRALVPHISCTLRALVPYVFSCLTFLVPYVLSFLTCFVP